MTIPPVPVTDGIPAECMVTLRDGRWTLAWLVGLRVEPFGEPYPHVRAACRESARVNEQIAGSES